MSSVGSTHIANSFPISRPNFWLGKNKTIGWDRTSVTPAFQMASHIHSIEISSCPIYALVLLAPIFWEVAIHPPNFWQVAPLLTVEFTHRWRREIFSPYSFWYFTQQTLFGYIRFMVHVRKNNPTQDKRYHRPQFPKCLTVRIKVFSPRAGERARLRLSLYIVSR